MEFAPDAVPDVLPHDGAAVFLRVSLYGGGNIADPVALRRVADALEKALARHVNETAGLRGDFAAGERCRAVAVETADKRAHVDADDVALFQAALAGDAVDHLVVDADAHARGEAVVVVKGRRRALFADKLIHGPVNGLCGDAGLYHLSGQRAGGGGNPSRPAHQLHFLIGFQGNPLRDGFEGGDHAIISLTPAKWPVWSRPRWTDFPRFSADRAPDRTP